MKAKKVLSRLLLLLMITTICGTSTVQAAKYEKTTGVDEEYLATDAKVPSISAEAAILMDAKTGEILFQKNATKKEYPASITKCMTALVAIENNNLTDEIEYSENAVFSVEVGSSGIAADVGEILTVDQSLYGAMLESANECCNALAEKTAGSIEGFVDMMNQKAEALGCVNTHFVNANGLYHKKHYTCAYDMALIVKAAMENEDWRRYTETVTYQCEPTNKQKETRYLVNHHKFVNGNLSYDNSLYKVEGGKTGYTVKCKNTLVTYASSNSDDLELICVLMRSDKFEYVNGKSVAYTYRDTQNLLDWGFSNFSSINSSVEFIEPDFNSLNYMEQAYVTLQPDTFINFTAEKECQIAVSNTYDINQLKGNLVLNVDPDTSKWGTYEFESGGNIIAQTEVYYAMNTDVLNTLYSTTKNKSSFDRIKYIIIIVILAIAALLALVVVINLLRRISLPSIFGNSKGLGSINSHHSSFKPSKRRKRASHRTNYGYIDTSSRRRRRRYSKKNKLHF